MNTIRHFRFPFPILPLFLIAVLLVSMTVAAPTEPTRETYRPVLTPEVREASLTAWRLARCGLLNSERMIIVVAVPNDPNGAVRPILLPATFEDHLFTFLWRPGTVATLHTHPNDARPEPSNLDVKMATDQNVPVFTISSRGLYVYDPYLKQTVQLERGVGWMSK